MQTWKRTLAALLAVAFTVGVLWFTNRDVSPEPAAREDGQAQSATYRVISTEGPVSALPDSETPGPLYGWALIWTLFGVFAGGMALNLTPCIYPLIPITVSYFVGQSARTGESRGNLALHGSLYVLGLATTNSLLGALAALTGGLMGALLQNPLLLIGVAAILLFFATGLFGLWEFRLPASLTCFASKNYTGYFGSLFMGLTLGLVAAPCIGPFVLGLLTWVAAVGSPWFGFLVFFILSLGLGVPLFLLAMFSGQIEKLPQSGGWMIWVRKLMGWVLVAMAVYFVKPVFPQDWATLLFALVALAAGLHLGWIDKSRAGFRVFGWLKAGIGVTCVVLAASIITSWAIKEPDAEGIAWEPYSEEILQEAQKQGKPVIIDFYAAWCAPCCEMEEVTFYHPSVTRQSKDFVMIKVDLTRGGNELHERLLEKYEVKGVPTIVFLDRDGRERRDLRLVDYTPPGQFLDHMAKLQ